MAIAHKANRGESAFEMIEFTGTQAALGQGAIDLRRIPLKMPAVVAVVGIAMAGQQRVALVKPMRTAALVSQVILHTLRRST